MVRFSAMHKIAEQRGDGLRPALLRLLEKAAPVVEGMENAAASSTSETGPHTDGLEYRKAANPAEPA
jgi:hypothetical protein